MTRQWAVVVRPDATHVVRALGPIATRERAERVVDRIVAWEEREEASDRFGLTWLAQAVELESVAEFMRELDAGSTDWDVSVRGVWDDDRG